ncbi:heavy metal translocating P-type ATPase [Desulfosporosinus metallidurans]|uniref:Lead, cadmium, zinc and mercury transporting ATPase n=1 Tax=Desulfosporosinus metallidurans TaxID=1888891 RepID=A0A1Q8QYY4_9FIRM|nr:heavy metal translocating P-type ATPase [Desulfosporosinus metallidurans]OLN32589.1 Lead, cadmium, zinc and mercury transporting ATPase [Desulfosporosinus metallidurans]
MRTSWNILGSRHKGLIVTALSLGFIILAWYSGKYGHAEFEVPFYLLAYAIGGYQKAWEGLQTLIKEKDLDVDLLMVLAAIGAASIGFWRDGAILILIFSLSGALEGYTLERTNDEIKSIMKLRPEEAIVLHGNVEKRVRVEELQQGDHLLVRPGERIAADGIVSEGFSSVNQASITGESIPIDKSAGDEVFAGTMNGQGALVIEMTKPAEATLLAKIIHLVQEAQSERPPSQLFMERFEGIYAKIVVTGAVLIPVLSPFVIGWSWSETIYKAMIFLVVASPCALVSSVMPAVLSGISNGARKGILFKGGAYLETIGDVSVVAFDKTGTLTEGIPRITQVIPYGNYTENEVLSIAASLETWSEHPIAKAIIRKAKGKNLHLSSASKLEAVPGFGVHGIVEGQEYRIGKLDLIGGQKLPEEEMNAVQELEKQGNTVIFVQVGNERIGVLAVQDTLRPQAKESISRLKKMGIKVVMLTGDSSSTAKIMGEQVGVDQVYSELLPEHKVDIIKKLGEYGKVAMVGDGVNDAPALAVSSVGIAMGAAGTDVAMETANVVLMADDISKVSYAIALGRRTTRVVKQNVTFAIAVIFVLVLSNFFGNINLPLGVIGHEGSTIIVIISGLRLLR